MRLLDIYLDDHWAGAAAVQALAHRMLHNNRGTRWAADLAWLVDQIETDDETLDELRGRLQVDGGKAKRVLALVGERIGRLKPNGRLVAYSPLSRVLEAEAMMAGVAVRHRLWAAMRHSAPRDVDLSEFDFAALEKRAEEQMERIRAFHQQATAAAFGGNTTDLR